MNEQDGRPVSRRAFLGATAAAATAGTASTAAAQEEGGGDGTVTVEVGPNGDFVFTPGTDEVLTIPPGTTVVWEWESDTHNIVVGSQPDGANWAGHEAIENTGFTYEHTFETTGDYHYWCQPHRQAGMVADITVEEGASLPGEGEGEGSRPSVVSDGVKTLGVASTGGMAAVLGLAYLFIKYGGNVGGGE